MTSTCNIIRKDLIRFRFIFAIWTLFIVAKYVFFAAIAGVWGDANFMLLFRVQQGPGPFTFAVEPLVAYFLVAWLIYEDPPAGKDPFWVTRPISGGQLLVAKLLAAGLMFVVWPVLLGLPWLIECGYGPAGIAEIAAVMGAIYSIVVLMALACASATDAYPRYILWTLAGLPSVALILTLPLQLPHDVNIIPSFGALLVHLGVAGVTVSLIALEIMLYRYLVRSFRRSLVIVTGVTLLGGTLVFSSPLPGIAHWFGPADQKNSGDEAIRLSIAGPMRVADLGKSPAADLVIPVKVEGLPKNKIAFLYVSGTWKSADAKVWSQHGESPSQQLIARVSRQILDLPPADLSPPVEAVGFAFGGRHSPTQTWAQWIADQAVSFHGTASLYIAEGRRLAELPVHEQTRRFAGGSLSITHMDRQGDQLTFDFNLRMPSLDARALGIVVIALVNRDTGEAIEPAARTRQGMGMADIDLVLVTRMTASFKLPPTPGWLDRATFAVIGFDQGHGIRREIETRLSAAPAADVPGNP